MQAPLPVSVIISLTFGLHIILVNLDIALATFIPLLEWMARKGNDDFLMDRAKNLMRYYASTYAIAGVFGTAFTVSLLSFYPQFLGLAGHLTFAPFGIAILMIALRFLTIVLYWYLWDKISGNLHLTIGALLALTGYIIPFGFRAVFAFLNVPTGLHLQPKLYLDLLEALTNPTFLPLYLKSVFGALAAGSLMLASAYAYRYAKAGSNKERYSELVGKFIEYGALFLALMVIFGPWYAISLSVSKYKFENIFGFLFGASPKYNYGWLFVIKMIFVLIQFFAVIYVLRGLSKLDEVLGWAEIAGPAGMATILTGELLNMHSQLPYFIAQPEVVNSLPIIFKQALLTTNANSLATLPELYAITIVFLIPLLIAVAALFYLILRD